jgi:alcohol dehydrogenase class IV
MTPILGETRDGVKTTQRSREILPSTVIYDVDLTLGLPVAMSASSGMNAIAHAVEALYAPENNPIITMMAEAGIGALAQALPQLMHSAADKAARTEALYGAWLCGTCLGSVSMSLHHKLCHVLGGSFDLPHAETHAIILPHATAYNADAAPKAMANIARALGCDNAAQGLHDLLLRLGIPSSLRQIGMPEDGIETAASLVLQAAYANPRTIELGSIRNLIARAYRGDAPAP